MGLILSRKYKLRYAHTTYSIYKHKGRMREDRYIMIFLPEGSYEHLELACQKTYYYDPVARKMCVEEPDGVYHITAEGLEKIYKVKSHIP